MPKKKSVKARQKKIVIGKIQLTTGKIEFELTVEEAKRLRKELDYLLCSPSEDYERCLDDRIRF